MKSKVIYIDMEDLGKEINILTKEIEREIRTVDLPEFYRLGNEIGKRALRKIKNNIRQAKKRPGGKGNLEKAMTIKYFTGGWGIGNISFLNKVARYWYFVNFGVSMKGMRIPGRGKAVPFGYFKPGIPIPCAKGKDSMLGRWIVGGNNAWWSFRAKQGIQFPLNYISKTTHWLNNFLDKVLKK